MSVTVSRTWEKPELLIRAMTLLYLNPVYLNPDDAQEW